MILSTLTSLLQRQVQSKPDGDCVRLLWSWLRQADARDGSQPEAGTIFVADPWCALNALIYYAPFIPSTLHCNPHHTHKRREDANKNRRAATETEIGIRIAWEHRSIIPIRITRIAKTAKKTATRPHGAQPRARAARAVAQTHPYTDSGSAVESVHKRVPVLVEGEALPRTQSRSKLRAARGAGSCTRPRTVCPLLCWRRTLAM